MFNYRVLCTKQMIIDIHVEVPAVPYKDLMQESYAEPSKDIQVDHISEAIQYRNLDRGSQFK